MARSRRIGILTGGGDVPGLNAVIKSIVYQSAPMGYEVLVSAAGGKASPICSRALHSIRNTFCRSIMPTPVPSIAPAALCCTLRALILAKCALGSVPKHISAEKLAPLEVAEGLYDFTPVVVDNIAHLGLDYLIPIGGDDTLSFAGVLDAQGVQLIGIPKTMDNDVQGTEYCIGFSTAITRGREAINRQRTMLGSHERIGIFRMFGRDAGFTALYSAYVTGGRCVIPEIEFDLQRSSIFCSRTSATIRRYSVVIASEGALWKGQSLSEYGEADAYGHKKKADIGLALAEEIQPPHRRGHHISDLTYELRGGEPDALD